MSNITYCTDGKLMMGQYALNFTNKSILQQPKDGATYV